MAIKVNMAARGDALFIPFFSSCIIHVAVLALAATVTQRTHLSRQEFFPIALVEVVPAANEPTIAKEEPTAKIAPRQRENTQEARRTPKNEALQRERSIPATKEEPAKPPEAISSVTPKLESLPSLSPTAPVEGGGSKAGAENLFDQGDAAAVPGTGTSGGGGGTAASGLGRGSGAPGLPARPVMKTNSEAKPIQTARAAYPPMALRAGLESDVTLRIEVDPQGNVTKAEISKSGGSGFDEEALKAVKQSRFVPAQRDGYSVPAEFTYIYRFRLQK